MATVNNQSNQTNISDTALADSKKIVLEDVTKLGIEDLSEAFKAGDLELCVEPLSEWGSDLETLLQKLEKGVMQWYETGSKRTLSICFMEASPVLTSEVPAPEKIVEGNVPLTTPATLS
jgi:hypothetical protein